MNTQVSLQLPNTMFRKAKKYAESHGFVTVQEFIREILREKLFEDESINGLSTYLASERSLAKHWLSDEEEKAWAHLQKEM